MSTLRRYVVLNNKGGCGKSTVATSLAAYYASQGHQTALFDYDPQGASSQWLSQRPQHMSPIHGVSASRASGPTVTRTFLLRVPPGTERSVLDTPVFMARMDLVELLRTATALLVPVMPSVVDTNATARFLRDLTSVVRAITPGLPVALVGNRMHPGEESETEAVKQLANGFQVPLVTCLRESVSYHTTMGQGVGVHELITDEARTDRIQWQPLVDWLEESQSATERPYRQST